MKIIKSLFDFANSFAINSILPSAFDEKWPQIKDYHNIIKKSFKAKELNLESIKSNSKILLEQAESLSVESMPEEFRNPKMIETLLALKRKTVLVHELIEKEASDAEIKAASDVLHETFNKIIELCITEKA